MFIQSRHHLKWRAERAARKLRKTNHRAYVTGLHHSNPGGPWYTRKGWWVSIP